MLRYAGLGACVFLTASGLAQTPADPEPDHWDHIAKLNSLTAEGNTPFYLKIEFQVFDLQGKPGETGTAEVWWGPHRRYQIIASPSWNEASAPEQPERPQTRQSYLINVLMDQIMHPMQNARISPASKIVEEGRKLGSITLRCLSTDPATPASSTTSFCVEPGNDELRVSLQNTGVVLRNKMARFHETDVALDLTVSYGVSKAITGKIVALTAIPADDEHIKPLTEPATSVSHHREVIAGKKIGGKTPEYPYIARQNHATGAVLIGATISKEGNLTSPFVIASPDPSLADAALNAVRTWKYQPYLLNGEPAEVDTTVVVNFNLSVSLSP